MRISKLHVVNFRSILDETLECDNLTILIGRNGAGKSAFMQALRLFMDTSASPTAEDFYDRDATRQILIEVFFTDLNGEEQAEFKSYLENGHLVVQRRFPGGDYYGRVTGCKELDLIRNMQRKKVKVSEIADELARLVGTGRFPGLKPAKQKIDDEVDRWERENADHCEPYFRAGIFQGPTNIAGGKMRNRTHFVYIAPVREAEADACSVGKQTPLGALVNPLIIAIADKNNAVKIARESLDTGYASYKNALVGAPEKEALEADLTRLLQRYDAESAAQIQLSLDDSLSIPQARPRVWLTEDGFQGEVARKGHGLQRLFIFSILELYEKFRAGATDSGVSDSMMLAIEEPELYQHPTRSRALSQILSDLCQPKDERGFNFQVFFSTHSPYFVSLDCFPSIRRVEKVASSSGPMETKVRRTSLKQVGETVLKALGRGTDATEASSWARFKSILGLRGSEGFFSDGIILVEGPEDEAIITAMARYKKVSLDGAGISIIPAEGKTKLPSLFALYSLLGIKVYLVFDADGSQPDDTKAHTDYNKALLGMIGEPPEARPKTKVGQTGTVWEDCFLADVRNAFGKDVWNSPFEEACKEYAMTVEQASKKFAVVLRTTESLLSQGRSCEPLERLWRAISERLSLESEGTIE